MKPIVYPYKMGSQSAKALAKGLGALRVYPDRNYKNKQDHLVINWGNSTVPWWITNDTKMLNLPMCVRTACNKLDTFRVLASAGVSIPEFTTVISSAREWEGVVVCRTTLTGHAGRGIVIAETPEEIVSAPLYTKHANHDNEYRVHIFQGEILDFTQKKKRRGIDVNPYVRNLDGNWVFCRHEITLPVTVAIQAVKAVEALGLDFGAVDIGYKEDMDTAYVFEINSSPGLVGTTLEKYLDKFRSIL